MIRTNDLEKPYETPLGQKAKERVQEVRSDRALEVSYMTYAQKIMDERRYGFNEGLAEGEARGEAKGRAETLKSAVLAMKDLAAPADIARRLELSLEYVLKILNQEK